MKAIFITLLILVSSLANAKIKFENGGADPTRCVSSNQQICVRIVKAEIQGSKYGDLSYPSYDQNGVLRMFFHDPVPVHDDPGYTYFSSRAVSVAKRKMSRQEIDQIVPFLMSSSPDCFVDITFDGGTLAILKVQSACNIYQ